LYSKFIETFFARFEGTIAFEYHSPSWRAYGKYLSLLLTLRTAIAVSIGEMTTYRPVHGGFIRQTADFVDPALGFAEGGRDPSHLSDLYTDNRKGINFWFSVGDANASK
jgi:hypothetical protein